MSYHHLRVNGFDDEKDIIRGICDRMYKLYFKRCKETEKQKRNNHCKLEQGCAGATLCFAAVSVFHGNDVVGMNYSAGSVH